MTIADTHPNFANSTRMAALAIALTILGGFTNIAALFLALMRHDAAIYTLGAAVCFGIAASICGMISLQFFLRYYFEGA